MRARSTPQQDIRHGQRVPWVPPDFAPQGDSPTVCFDSRARPPIPVIAGAALDGRDVTLTSADGTRFSAYAVRAGQPGGIGVVILPDIRGLHTYYTELADRFAERGIDAVAIDYFGRTGGLGRRDDDFAFRPHVEQTRAQTIHEDVAAAAALLRSSDGGNVQKLFTIGFCFGGSISWAQAATDLELAGAIGFYGNPTMARGGGESAAELASRFRCPILALFGGTDQGIPASAVEQFNAALSAAGKPHEVKVYVGAPHSFFDRHAKTHADASNDAWRRILDFIDRYAAAA